MCQEVAAKRLGRRVRLETFLGRADPAHIEIQALPAADPRIAVLFDGAQQRALRIGIQILEAAQVERTARSLIEGTWFDLAVALAAEQRRGGVRSETGRNHREKRLRGARAQRMQVARIRFPARSQLAYEQHRRGAGSRLLDLFAQHLRDLGLADRHRQR